MSVCIWKFFKWNYCKLDFSDNFLNYSFDPKCKILFNLNLLVFPNPTEYYLLSCVNIKYGVDVNKKLILYWNHKIDPLLINHKYVFQSCQTL